MALKIIDDEIRLNQLPVLRTGQPGEELLLDGSRFDQEISFVSRVWFTWLELFTEVPRFTHVSATPTTRDVWHGVIAPSRNSETTGQFGVFF